MSSSTKTPSRCTDGSQPVISLSRKFLFLAVLAAKKANEGVEKAYTLGAAKALSLLLEDFTEDTVKHEWRKLNIATYRKARVVKGDALYTQLSKFASMLLAVGLQDEDVLQQYVEGKWTSLQGVYGALSGKKAKKAEGAKPRSFAKRAESFVSNATPRQRQWLVKNVRKLVAAV